MDRLNRARQFGSDLSASFPEREPTLAHIIADERSVHGAATAARAQFVRNALAR